MIRRWLLSLAAGTGLALLYSAAGKLGLSLAFSHQSISPVWPATGLALAALLLLGLSYWPAIFVGAFLLNFTHTLDLLSSSGIAAGNTLEAVLGAMLARRFARGAAAFDSAADILRFVCFAAIPSTAISATVGVVSLRAANLMDAPSMLPLWLTWWTGDFVSDLVVAPLLLIWLRGAWRRPRWRRTAETAALVLLLLTSSFLVFGKWNLFSGQAYPLAFLVMPSLLWAAARFGPRGDIAAACLVSGSALWSTLNGYGPFALPNRNDSLLVLQAFIGVSTLTMLVLAAALAERSRAAEILQDSRQRLRLALQAGGMGTWEWDIPVGTVRWSESLERIHGLQPGTFSGTFEAFMDDVHPDDRRRVQEQIADTLHNRREHHIEYRLLLKGGQVRWVEGRGQIFLDRRGNPVRMLGICMDITQRRLVQEERDKLLDRERAARVELERASRAKDDFLAVLSHELRTPLTPVMLTASALQCDPELPPHLRVEMERIRRNVEMEARLIDDLLDLTRISRGKLQLELQPADVHEIVGRAIDICCRDIAANLVVHLDAPWHHARVDAGRVQQVFWNLLNNARKFTPQGGTITVGSRNSSDGARLIVEVSDTGVGISPQMMPKLFAAFEQGESARIGRTGGLGLGLAISKALVAAHDGTLSAASDGVGRGATFTVAFATVPAPQTTPKDHNGQPAAHLPRRSARILLVEDHAGTLSAMTRILSMRNHHVVAATTVASAIEAAAREPIDLVISDLGLPDGMGYDLMREIAAKHSIRGIALSGHGMAADIERSRQVGFVEHLVKPVDAGTLEAAIDRALANGA